MSNERGLPKHFLRRCLLLLLAERADYGYDLVERLEPFGFDGSDPGGVYRTLRLMERDGALRSVWRPSGAGPYRRVYELTELGLAELSRAVADTRHAQDILEVFLERCEELEGVHADPASSR